MSDYQPTDLREPKSNAELADQALQPAAEDPCLPDPELEAMRLILDAIDGLDVGAQGRVLSYCQARCSALGAALTPHFPPYQPPPQW